MGMTLDEAIKHAEEVAEENEKVADTGILEDGLPLDVLYCDDTEVIEEHKERCRICAAEHRQLAEWLKDYKRLKEQEPCEDCISRRDAKKIIFDEFEGWPTDEEVAQLKRLTKQLDELPSVSVAEKTGRWIVDVDRWGDVVTTVNGYRCDKCNAFNTDKDNYCPNCGAKMQEVEV